MTNELDPFGFNEIDLTLTSKQIRLRRIEIVEKMSDVELEKFLTDARARAIKSGRQSMRIYRGKMVSKRFVPTLLEAVPEEDLNGLNSIHVKMMRHSRSRGRHSPTLHRVEINIQSHLFRAENQFSMIDDDFYGLFARSFAKTLYHEIGHHWDQKNNMDYYWFNQEYDSASFNDAYKMIELVADNYEKKIMPVAEEMRLYDKLTPSDMPYAYAMFKKYVHGRIRRAQSDGEWSGLNPVLNYLRKQKLGPEAKYNVPQLFNKTFGEYKYKILEDNCKRRFRRFAVKQLDPLWYVSKGNLHYPYFTDDHLEAIISLKDSFNIEMRARNGE